MMPGILPASLTMLTVAWIWVGDKSHGGLLKTSSVMTGPESNTRYQAARTARKDGHYEYQESSHSHG